MCPFAEYRLKNRKNFEDIFPQIWKDGFSHFFICPLNGPFRLIAAKSQKRKMDFTIQPRPVGDLLKPLETDFNPDRFRKLSKKLEWLVSEKHFFFLGHALKFGFINHFTIFSPTFSPILEIGFNLTQMVKMHRKSSVVLCRFYSGEYSVREMSTSGQKNAKKCRLKSLYHLCPKRLGATHGS